ncbi:MAG: glycosyltransferase family 4 protein [Rhodospirillales bacterium]|nr:glycosyltransferase family 4 protein [Rhodospirillales bacterium]
MSMVGNAAILYAADAYVTDRQDLKGRHAAGAGFLRGLFRHLQAPNFACLANTRPEAETFAAQARANGRGEPVHWIAPATLKEVSQVGALHVPDPSLAPWAWRRRISGAQGFSLTGVTHTICSAGTLEVYRDLLTAPIESWDAVICTSRAARAVMEAGFAEWEDYLGDRLNAQRFTRPQLPVIPLGVHADLFAPVDAPASRAGLRAELGLAEDDVAVLFFGRLAFHAKGHPLPMLLGLEEARMRTGRNLVLLLCGRYPNPETGEEFARAAKDFCPNVPMLYIDGTDEARCRAVWHAADIFTSLSDNLQETFGLTPVEAMAAGLPVVASDWDGYRDTIADGETGILIPTLTAPLGSGRIIGRAYAEGLLNYDHYIGSASLCTAVDIPACAEAYARLASDPALRRRMGEAGRRRVRERFDWKVVIAAYQALWAELAERRRAGTETAPPRPDGPVWPCRDDPFSLFRSFPSRVLDEETVLTLTAAPEVLDTRLGLGMNTYSLPMLFSREEVGGLVQRLASGPIRLGDLQGKDSAQTQALRRAAAWLIKMGMAQAG